MCICTLPKCQHKADSGMCYHLIALGSDIFPSSICVFQRLSTLLLCRWCQLYSFSP